MVSHPKVSRKKLLKMIAELEQSPNDKMRILGEGGITLAGVGLGAASAATIAGAAGATTILGSSTVAAVLPFLAAATPVGWTVGLAAAGGLLVYGLAVLVRGGGLAEGRKIELLQIYREREVALKARDEAGQIDANDRTQFIISLREVIDKDAIRPDQAFRLIEQVEAGRITVRQALSTLQLII